MFRLCCLLQGGFRSYLGAVVEAGPSTFGGVRRAVNAVEHSHPRGQPTQRTGNAVLDAWPLPAQGPDPEADEPLAREMDGDDEPITEENPATSASEP
jgi:hypothetical protein